MDRNGLVAGVQQKYTHEEQFSGPEENNNIIFRKNI
jgi:hypothetical protein